MDHSNNTGMQPGSGHALTPQEDTLRSLCKQILKSRLFRGFYEERRYVETVGGYRDIVALHRSERELEKIVLDIRAKLQMFYRHKPTLWVGITHGALPGMKVHKTALETLIWAELEEMAFGQYWFNIKSIRFRDQEIIVKLKMVRSVEPEDILAAGSPAPTKFGLTPQRKRRSLAGKSSNAVAPAVSTAEEAPPLPSANDSAIVSRAPVLTTSGGCGPLAVAERKMGFSEDTVNQNRPAEPQVDFADFIELINEWGRSIKHTVYDFMSNDINRDNIVALLRFLALVVVSVLSSGMVAVKFLGVFALRFMFEFSRFTHVISPVLLKIIELCNKMIGGFYLLMAMVWKDVMGTRQAPKPSHESATPALDYKRPTPYKSIEYHVRQGKLQKDINEFERKFQ